ncbi:serine hydrolase domain-containing protein [Planctobacterium marinum]|uniref:6-aminohexanoate-dimer hydrolase n=1 Tax=Planctobacterium marinum TaxID=1631968 RepID=A0AA48KQ78_9ALTE|nr:6-aminohexanoate-dimer hydrolase [Planctobacterium marinum]
MKKVFIVILVLVALHFVTRYSLGFSVYRLGDALEVSASLGAKIACSARYVSGFDESLIVEDLASYSPATRLLDIVYDDAEKRVTANMLGLASYTGQYRDGLGCTLEIGDTTALDALQVKKVEAEAAPWPQGNQVSTVQDNYQQLTDQILHQDNQGGLQTRALLVVKDGQVVAESYAEGVDNQTQLLGWSMGKSLTAMMLGRMQTLGLVNLQQKAGFAPWQSDARQEITLEQLLTMSSGLKFNETYAPGSDSTRMLFTAYSASDVALTATAEKSPGSYFSYSSGTTNILIRWMRDELGSNQALLDFFHNEILQPLSMADTTFEVDPSGVYVGSSYIFATARDWAKMGFLMLRNGTWQGQQLLQKDWVSAAQKPISAENYQKYGYQFWLNQGGEELRWNKIPADAYMMMGNRKQVVMIVPSKQLVLVRLGWTSGSYPTEDNFARLIAL